MNIELTARLDNAFRLASYAHVKANHYRKGGLEIPYIMHPFAVMTLLTNITDDEDVLIAALLHDVLEDVDSEIVSEQDIVDRFGDKVLQIIKDVSKNSEIKNWKESNQDYIDHLVNKGSREAMLVSLGDKTHNLFSTLLDYDRIGDEVWERFSTKNKEDQVWWYSALEEVFTKHLPDSYLLSQYKNYVTRLKSL